VGGGLTHPDRRQGTGGGPSPGGGIAHPVQPPRHLRCARAVSALDPGHIAIWEVGGWGAARADHPQQRVGGIVVEGEVGVAVGEDDGEDR